MSKKMKHLYKNMIDLSNQTLLNHKTIQEIETTRFTKVNKSTKEKKTVSIYQ